MSHDDVKNSLTTANRYELIVVASREARRLNDYYRQRNVQPKSRVTTEAIGHAVDDGLTYAFRASDAVEPELVGEGAEFSDVPSSDASAD